MITNIFTLQTDGCDFTLRISEDFNDKGTIGYLALVDPDDPNNKITGVGLDETDLRMLAANLLAFADFAKSQKLKA